jgi:hypothetical protein
MEAVNQINQVNGDGPPRKNWKAYWKTISDFLASSRSGRVLVDEHGNNAEIIPAHYRNYFGDASSKTLGVASVADNNVLDIGAQDFSFFGWIKAYSTYVAGYPLLGKGVSTSPNGYYLILGDASKKFNFRFHTSTAYFNIVDTNTDVSTCGWIHFIVDINQTTKKARLFLNNQQIGADLDYTGTIANLASTIKFVISDMCDGSGNEIIAYGQHMDAYNVGVKHALLTPTERTTLYNKGIITGCAAFYPLGRPYFKDGYYVWADITGNGLHLRNINYGAYNYGVGQFLGGKRFGYNTGHGSTAELDYGYDIYETTGGLRYRVPHLIDGSSIAGITDTLILNIPGSLTTHNLADSMILPVGSLWDKSDATIWKASRRYSPYYDGTNANTKKQHHVYELNKDLLLQNLNSGYKNRIYPQITNNSYNERQSNLRIGTFATDQNASKNINILKVTGDNGIRPSKLRSGVALCFDDTSQAAGWLLANKTLYPKYQWKATFCLEGMTGFYTNQEIFHELLRFGHEFANHSAHHDDIQTYLNTPHTSAELFAWDIVPQATSFLSQFDYYPRTIATWGAQYGAYTDFANYCLANGYTFIRTLRQATIPVDINEACYDGTSQSVGGIPLADSNYPLNEAGDNAIKACIDYARDHDKVLLLCHHAIGDQAHIDRFDMICKYVYDNNMTFYGFSELIPALFGL